MTACYRMMIDSSRFYRAVATQALYSHEKNICPTCPSVRLSVLPSVKRVNCDKTKDTYTHILIPQERSMHLALSQTRDFVSQN